MLSSVQYVHTRTVSITVSNIVFFLSRKFRYMWCCVIRWVVLSIFKKHNSFSISGTTHPVTQHHIPEGWILSSSTVRILQLPNIDNVEWYYYCPEIVFTDTIIFKPERNWSSVLGNISVQNMKDLVSLKSRKQFFMP